MTTFVLVHGAQHGAWCWDRLVPELQARGHEAIAVDLPVEDTEMGLDGYSSVVADAAKGATSQPVLIGHSMAGMFLPLAAGRTRARAMVFLCAMVPVEGKSLADQAAADPSMIIYPRERVWRDEMGRTLVPPDVAREIYYEDCDDDTAAWAAARLRWQGHAGSAEPFPRDGWPSIPAEYILCTGDRCVSPEWSRRASRDRLGREAIELPGSHSPFLSRPVDLADVLSGLAATGFVRKIDRRQVTRIAK